MIWLVILTVSVTISILGYSVYRVSKERYRDQLHTKLKANAQIAASVINAQDHVNLLNLSDEKKEEYKRVRNILEKIKEADSDIQSIYTLKKKTNDDIYFVVNPELDSKKMTRIGDLYSSKTSSLQQAFTDKSLVYLNDTFVKINDGEFLTAYAPIYLKSGEIDGVVGVDISAKTILEQEDNLLKTVILSAVICILIGVLMGINFSRRITKSIHLLTKEVNKIQSFNFEESPKINSYIYEFNQLGNAISGMKQGLRSFKKYVPSDLVLDLLNNKKEAQLSVQKKEITVMFTDIVDFTVIAEKISLDDLLKILSEYFAAVADVITRNRGTVDKFIGDSIMAFWGAPQENVNHAYDACRTALEIQLVLHKLNKKLVDQNLPALNTRVGMSTGVCTVGNIGHKDRFNYTAIGDTVNVANRVEILNKNYSTDILITHSTYQIIRDDYDCIKLDSVAIKGKKDSVEVYQLLSVKNGQMVLRHKD